jgi:predicted Zn-dependent protease
MSPRRFTLLLAATALAAAVLLALPPAGPETPVAEAVPTPGALISRPRPEPPAATPLEVGMEVRTTAGQRRRLALPDGSVLFVNEKTLAKLDGPGALTLSGGEIYLETAPAGLTVHAAGSELTAKQAGLAVRLDKAGPALAVTRGHVQVKGLAQPLHAGQQLAAGAREPAPAPRASHALAWLHDLLCAAEAPLVPASDHAGGSLVAIDPNGQEAKLTLRRLHIDVHIEDGFARTTIDQTYFNHHSEQLEGTFYFPLPPDASLSRLAMYVGGQLMEGGMAERNAARAIYETIRYARKDPALLEWVDGSTFKMRVFPIEPRQEKRIILSYSQRLPALYGELSYRFPAGHTLQKVRDWSFEARVKGGAGWAWDSPSHKLQAQEDKKDLRLFGSAKDVPTDRDVVLTLHDPAAGAADEERVQFSTAAHEGAKYLMVRYRPRLTAKMAAHRRDWVFLVETSGDRDPLLARAQIEVMRDLLGHANPDDTFAVLTASTRVTAMAPEPLPVKPQNIAAAVAFLEGAHLVGALDLGQALTEAATWLKKGTEPHLVHLGSGVAAMGERRDDVLARRLPDGAKYVGVGVGRRWARSLMKAAAERTGGHFTQVNPDEPIGWRAFDLVATLNTPRLMGLEVRDKAGKAAFLPFSYAVAQGEELCAVTRVEGDAPLPEAVVVRGTLDGKPTERVLPVKGERENAGYLPRTWAKLEIDRLLAEDVAKHKDAIIALSKAMYVITPFTSLLVLENEDQYTQYRVDRGRKDHWALYPLPEKIPVVVEPDPDDPDPQSAKAGKLPAKKVAQTIAVRGAHEGPASKGGDSSKQKLNELPGLDFGYLPPDKRVEPVADLVLGTDLNGELEGKLRPLGGRADNLFRSGAIALPPGAATPEKFMKLVPQLSDGKIRLRAHVSAGQIVDAVEIELADAKESGIAPSERIFARAGPGIGGVAASAPPPPVSEGGPASPAQLPETGMGSMLGSPMTGTFYGRNGATIAHPPAANKLPLAWYELKPAKEAKPPAEGEVFRRLLWQVAQMPQGGPTYERPSYQPEPRVFSDLLAYAPGLNTSPADVRAVLEAEAVPGAWNKPGKVEPAAGALIDKARLKGWHSLTLPAQDGRAAFTIAFDEDGRFAFDRTLPPGLRERVVCDGKALTHLYPQLGLAAHRDVSRFHRAELAALVPWFLPPADEMARGADLQIAGERTVAVVPHWAGMLKKDADGKTPSYAVVQLVFAPDGRLAERRVVRMPSGEVLYRLTLTSDGTARLLDGQGKELTARPGKLGATAAPALTADTKDLLVLPLPYRTPEHVRQALKLQKKNNAELTLKEALPLLLAYVAQDKAGEADALFRQVFHAREQRQLGYYVLLASCGVNLDSDHGNVLAEHLDDPLAQYLALQTSPVLRKHASQWAVGSGSWQDGLLQHLAVSHALLQRWENPKVLKNDAARAEVEKRRALDYVKKNRDSLFGWALVCLVQDRAGDDAALHGELAGLFALFEDRPGLAYAARYERARSLWHAGKKDEARKQFRALYEAALKDEALPAIDGDFRAALLAGDGWGELMRQTAGRLVGQKRRAAVVALARQCWDLDDQPLACELLAAALDGIPDPDERAALALAGFDFLRETGQLAEADRVLQGLLADPKLARQGVLWRLGHALAEQRDMPARAVECLEKALEIEAASPPEVIDLKAARDDYGALLDHYLGLADAMVALKVAPAPDFLSRVIRAADRWRAVDNDPTAACQAAAKVLKRLGQKELAWDYLSTLVALHPNEAGPWSALAATLSKQGELELADRAYQAAAEAEPTDPQLLWDRARNLKQLGKQQQARELVRRIAEGTWQPRFQGLQAQARHLLQSP